MFPFFFLENWRKITLKNLILNILNPLAHLHIQGYSWTNCILKFNAILNAILRPWFSKQRLSRIPINDFLLFLQNSRTTPLFPTYFLHVIPHSLTSCRDLTGTPSQFSYRKHFRKWIQITYIHLIYPLLQIML